MNKEYEALLKENEKLKAELKEAREALEAIDFQTPALGGSKQDMKDALLTIDNITHTYWEKQEIKYFEV